MKNATLKLLLALEVGLIGSHAYGQECATLFVDPNLGGKAWVIQAESSSDNMTGAMISRRRWCGSLRGYCRGRDVSWNDSVSSVSVAPGCRLNIYEHAGYAGAKVSYGGFGGTQYPAIDLNDSVTSFDCTCQPPTVGTVLYMRAPVPAED